MITYFYPKSTYDVLGKRNFAIVVSNWPHALHLLRLTLLFISFIQMVMNDESCSMSLEKHIFSTADLTVKQSSINK